MNASVHFLHPELAEDIVFAVASQSDPGAFHLVSVDAVGHPFCSCNGVSFCSHIDASLVMAVEHVIAEHDRPKAAAARRRIAGRLQPPAEWKRDWLNKRRWLGLPALNRSAATLAFDEGRPIVSFAGRGSRERKRRLYEIEATFRGFTVIPKVCEDTVAYVVPDPDDDNEKIADAVTLGIPIWSYEDWDELAHSLMEHAPARITAARQKTEA